MGAISEVEFETMKNQVALALNEALIRAEQDDYPSNEALYSGLYSDLKNMGSAII